MRELMILSSGRFGNSTPHVRNSTNTIWLSPPVARQSSTRAHSDAGKVDCVILKDGQEFSPIINGTWQLAGGHGRAVFDHVFDRLMPHAEAGFTTFDTADIYGPSEEILGQLQSKWTTSGHKPLQLFTKYVPNLSNGPPSSAQVKEAIKHSRRALQVQAIDLVQVHWWDYAIPGLMDVMNVLSDLQAEGHIRSIGATNLDTSAVEKITDADISLVSNQVQFSLLDRRPLGPNGMLQLCKERDLKLLCYGVVGGGLLTDRHLRSPQRLVYSRAPDQASGVLELDTSSLRLYWNMVQRFGGEKVWRRLLHVLRDVADKHQTNISSVAIQWVMAQGGGGVAYPIIGVRNANHIDNNTSALSLRLDDEDLGYIDDCLKLSKPPKGDIYSYEREG